jgi:hypothetical protein
MENEVGGEDGNDESRILLRDRRKRGVGELTQEKS